MAEEMDFNRQDADDEEVFEIVDFTTASDWERFTAEIEEALCTWNITGSQNEKKRICIPKDVANADWAEDTLIVKYSDFTFSLSHHYIIQNNEDKDLNEEEVEPNPDDEDDSDIHEDLPHALITSMNNENDFPGRAHCLVRWYGVQEFIILTPTDRTKEIVSGAKAKLLQSSLAIAANNTNCQVPLFVQIMAPRDRMFLGIGYGNGIITHYDMVNLRQPTIGCTHMSGLLDMFKYKLRCGMRSPPVIAAVRFTYVLSEWPHTLWSQSPPDFDATLTEVGFSDLGNLPFGSLSDPISELQVSAMWPYVNEAMALDSEHYSDLNPLHAPVWTAKIITSSKVPGLLSEYLSEFIHVCDDKRTVRDLLGQKFNFDAQDDGKITNALSRLTEHSIPPLSSVIGKIGPRQTRSQSQSGESGPIPNEILVPILNYLFPDAEGDNPSNPYSNYFSQVPQWENTHFSQEHPFKNVFGKMKTTSVNGLVWRIGIVFCHVIHSLGGLAAAAHLWHEFVLELRFRYENNFLVPGLDEGIPDLGSSLLHQKIQMLNCCIQRKIRREDNIGGSDIDATDEEEFFECEEEFEIEEEDEDEEGGKCEPTFRNLWDRPEGRQKRFKDLTLLNSKDPLYVPITQEAAPLTEDKLEEQANTLMGMGSDSVGSHLRAVLMSSALLSDMESFKAANPGCVLEDFVRWYSPRDWITDDVDSDEESEAKKSKKRKTKPKGHLSSRMQIPGNLWQEVWESAPPVPAKRQKRLFDDTREAEQVLNWLANLNPGKVCSLLLPSVLHTALTRLTEEPLIYVLPLSKEQSLPQPNHSSLLYSQLELVSQRITRLSRLPFEDMAYKQSIEQITSIEFSIAAAKSLRLKLLGESEYVWKHREVEDKENSNSQSDNSSQMEDWVMKLLQGIEVPVKDGPKGHCGKIIKELFREANKVNQPTEEEYPDRMGSFDRSNRSNVHPSKRPNEMGKPVGREYLLRTTVPSPSPLSRPLPQRMFAVLQRNSFRLCGAFTEDTIFY